MKIDYSKSTIEFKDFNFNSIDIFILLAILTEKTFCDFSDEEINKMSEARIEQLEKCQNYDCFDCYGDHLSY